MVRMAERAETSATNFNAIKISIASPQQILNWSHGEVTKPETINYRTLRPEKDGLFCERLFGPTKDWECFCGKYKRIRYRGVICDRCGVEVTRSKVRRERMGHIRLAAPVAHIWFSKTTPSRLGLLLDLSPRNLERVLYFAQHIVVSVDEDARQENIEAEKVKHELASERVQGQGQERLDELNKRLEAAVISPGGAPEVSSAALDEAHEDEAHEAGANNGADTAGAVKWSVDTVAIQAEIDAASSQMATEQAQLDEQLKTATDELSDLRRLQLLSETRNRELKEHYSGVFTAGMGAEAILAILQTVDLEALREQLTREMQSTSGQRRKKAIKRLRVVESFRNSGNRVEDMIFSVLPVLPPELRPMVQLDGGRFATSDLNDLYRRVINRNNRLKRLMSLGAPEIIIRNEKRMLQEAVDALIDNGRRGRPIQGSHNHKLKSLSDLLRGKQGRFRQNLLGKRVDYSGRSVIVVGPELKMHQCGLPRRMALELFKPFVMHRLVILGIAPNIKNAKRMVERARGEVWDILEDVIKDRPVLLNRAPTLHRLGIQAFMPVLIDGNAIQLHPLVCSAFNADFDGDQMAVHVPLSRMAVLEAREAMLSTHNMLSPASGLPLVAPTLDMVLGCYYLTEMKGQNPGSQFESMAEASNAYQDGRIELQTPIYVRRIRGADDRDNYYETTLGRLIFNGILPDKFVHSENLPEEVRIQNKLIDRNELNSLTSELYRLLSNEETAEVLDNIKDLGFQYATVSGITVAISDIQVSPEKAGVLAEADGKVAQYNEEHQLGLISEEERYDKTIDTWAQASFQTAELIGNAITIGPLGESLYRTPTLFSGKGNRNTGYGGVSTMAHSGAKGNISQINQMAGMRGLVYKPGRQTYELPVKSSFREGLSALEYFISTHGSRKGLTDTALNTANSGYLTRRLIDVAQEVIVQEEDCGTLDGWTPRSPDAATGASLQQRIQGRLAAVPMAHPETGEILVDRNGTITRTVADMLVEAGITEVVVRSPLTCESSRGVCQKCYGHLPATGMEVQIGQAVGIIAAQSIGEPGTQLTMRTFHTGGVVGARSRRDEDNLNTARDLQAVAAIIREEADRLSESHEPPRAAARIQEYVGKVRGELEAVVSRIPEYEDRFRHELLPVIGRIQQDLNVHQSGVHPEQSAPELQAIVNKIRDEDVDRWGDVLLREVSRIREDVEMRNLDITGGLPRVEELFEARTPKTPAILAEIDGRVELREDGDAGSRLRLVNMEEYREDYFLSDSTQVLVDDGEIVEPGMVLATVPQALPPENITAESEGEYAIAESNEVRQILANVGGKVELTPGSISVVWEDEETREYPIPPSTYLRVFEGEEVSAGLALTSGPLNPHDLLGIRGKEALQSHLLELVQAVYQSQGVRIHDKHIEVILRQMLRRVQIESSGDSELIPGQMVDKFSFQEQNERLLTEGGEPATAKQVLLGITRASLLTDSFLSAASFQETTRVLTQAAVSGAQDWLLGLKENVIIGRLIPARIDIPGMDELLKPRTADLAAIGPGGWLRTPLGGASPFNVVPDDVPMDPGIFALEFGGEGGEALTPFGEHGQAASPFAPAGANGAEAANAPEDAGSFAVGQAPDAASTGDRLDNGANVLGMADESGTVGEAEADEGAE